MTDNSNTWNLLVFTCTEYFLYQRFHNFLIFHGFLYCAMHFYKSPRESEVSYIYLQKRVSYHFLSRKSTVPGEFCSSFLPYVWYHDTTFRILWTLVENSLKGNTILLCLGIFDPNLSRQPTHEIKAFFWKLGWLFLPQAISNTLFSLCFSHRWEHLWLFPLFILWNLVHLYFFVSSMMGRK